MDACSQPDLLAVDVALARIYQQLKPLSTRTHESEWVDVAHALDRVLAESIMAAINVPAGDNSAMDGYAVKAADCSGPNARLTLVGQALAGHPFEGALTAGQTVRIMTGALVPAGADAVVMQENTERFAQAVHIQQQVSVGENIRRAGEDIALGEQVLAQGKRLGALEIGLLASLGMAQVAVYRRVRIAVVTTGDELLPAGAAPAMGKIFDSNRPLLLALLQRLAVDVMDLGIVADDPVALKAAFTRAMSWADLLISTGGVSVGDADYTRDVLTDMGEIDFWKIAMKPGKPLAFGALGTGWFFGLPGNPVSTAVTYHQIVVPSVRYFAGEQLVVPSMLTAIAASPFKKQPGRMDFQRGILTTVQGINSVVSAGSQSSGVLRAMANANCYICLARESGSVAVGDEVSVIPFDRYIQ